MTTEEKIKQTADDYATNQGGLLTEKVANAFIAGANFGREIGMKTLSVRSEELFVENEANANLTAAAPEMGTMLQDSTDALKSLLALFGDSMSTTTRFGVSQQIKENELVINKALGL